MLATYISRYGSRCGPREAPAPPSRTLPRRHDRQAPARYGGSRHNIVVGLAALIFGGDMCVDNASQIARRLGVSESVIAITPRSRGTSLPELSIEHRSRDQTAPVACAGQTCSAQQHSQHTADSRHQLRHHAPRSERRRAERRMALHTRLVPAAGLGRMDRPQPASRASRAGYSSPFTSPIFALF